MPALLPSSDWTGLLPGPQLRATAGVFTAQGTSHANNDDCEFISPKHDLFIVADGMGGHFAGEQASRFVVDTLSHELSRLSEYHRTPAEVQHLVRRALKEAHCLVLEMGDVLPQFQHARSTVALALLFGSRLFVAGFGDSRVYLLRQQLLEQLTHDTMTMETLAINSGAPGTNEPHPARSELISSLEIEYFPADQEIRVLGVRPQDRILLCTDGVSDALADSDIRTILNRVRNCRAAARELVHEAVANGSSDDATALVIDISEVPHPAESMAREWWRRATTWLFGVRGLASQPS